MNNTLSFTDVHSRTGYTVVDGVKVVQYICTIEIANPANMRISSTRMNGDLYKLHRDICRADLAAFEDAAYELQEAYLAKLSE